MDRPTSYRLDAMTAATQASPSQPLPRSHWQSLAQQHRESLTPILDRVLQRKHHRIKHPVEDFLFTYYNFPPGKLSQWLPPLHQPIAITADDLQTHPHLLQHPHCLDLTQGTYQLDPNAIPEKTRQLARWIATLCQNILNRPAHHRCHGLHEWAMVYQLSQEQLRHQQLNLRLPPDQISQLIQSQPITCTHYDAYRFFTPPAAPLNSLRPTLDSRLENEQSGCLHANMDLYKWAHKLWPWIGSQLIADTFHLALQIRTIDMRASPYDLSHLGYPPIPIETPEGRTEYQSIQRQLTAQATPLRQALHQTAQTLTT